MFVGRVLGLIGLVLASATGAHANLSYHADQASDGTRFIIVEGTFEFSDDLGRFKAAVRDTNPTVIGFNSPGGNIIRAIELGRLIRLFGLHTHQVKTLECASACSLAFFGGITRTAEPGAIGVHKSSFSGDMPMNSDDAVSAVQAMTADIIAYMVEMGVDPGILQLSLRYDADDIRYLSKSEMQQFRVTTMALGYQAAPAPSVARAEPEAAASQAQSGRVRHPKGAAPLLVAPDGKAHGLRSLANGSAVAITSGADEWYRVQAGSLSGYMHHSWVMVDQFEASSFDRKHIQVKSFRKLPEARAYVQGSALPLSVHLATNGWYAVTLRDTYPSGNAGDMLRSLKAQGAVPDDSLVTFGNNYVRRVCCGQ
ncbi:MAG TPA: hypothetical protein VGN97_02815 [Mesorhizobium sp.]|nr:hypothetical protein [Mesorhizobium sp.]